MQQSNLRNFHYTQGKVAPLQPISGHPMGNVNDQDRAPQWVDPYEFWNNNRYWNRHNGGYTQETKDRLDAWVNSMKGQKKIRPRTLTSEEFSALCKSLK